jgi:antitoxin component YwqK of YwqJK toxin-antitoxin module
MSNNTPLAIRFLPKNYCGILVVTLLCLSPFAEAQTVNDTIVNQVDDKGMKQGKWVKVHPETGEVAYRATFKNDKAIGSTERYYEDGSLQAKIKHRSDGVDVANIYHPGVAVLMASGNYRSQERDSTWHFFGADSSLTAIENYRNGKKHGSARTYYTDGSISEKATYDDGAKVGAWEQFYPDGTLRLRATVDEGIQYVGEYLSNYPNGKPMLKGAYVDGRREGSWFHHHEDGSIEVIYVYREGKVESEHRQNGVFDDYYNDDILRQSHTFKQGKKHGPFKEYYHQGEWRTEEVVDEFGNNRAVQKLHGTQVMREGKYFEGALKGEVINYNEKGKVIKKEQY